MKIINRSFHREYTEVEVLEAGIALTGGEVKVVRENGLKLEGSFVKIRANGVYLINAEIPAYQYAKNTEYESKRNRKLLLNKKEIERWNVKMASSGGLTIVPVSCYNKGPLIKLEIALARGRRDLEKRKLEKNQDIKINQKREAKEYMKEDF